MAAKREVNEEWDLAVARARAQREAVADALRYLVLSADRVGSLSEVADQVRSIAELNSQIARAYAREEQSRVEGNPIARIVEDRREMLDARRGLVMNLAVSAALWVVAIDLEGVL